MKRSQVFSRFGAPFAAVVVFYAAAVPVVVADPVPSTTAPPAATTTTASSSTTTSVPPTTSSTTSPTTSTSGAATDNQYAATAEPIVEAGSTLAGGGSSFAAVEMNQWTDDVQSLNPPLEISYTPSSSGNGRTDFREGTIAYADSDIPYQGSSAANPAPGFSFEYIPVVAGGLSFMYNLPGITTLKLDAAAACGIFTGEIKTWDDPALTALNPGLSLPSTAITPVLRGDLAGTSWVLQDWCITQAPAVWDSFVSYVQSNNLQGTPPVSDTVPSSFFPAVGVAQTANGDSGTAAIVGSANGQGDITYVEPEYAKTYNDKPVAFVENSRAISSNRLQRTWPGPWPMPWGSRTASSN